MTDDLYDRANDEARHAHRELIERLRAENERLNEVIFGVGVNLWDRAELSERDEAGNQTILLWHPSGMPCATLSVAQHAPGLGAAHIELLISDLADVFMARERARAALNEKAPADGEGL